MDGRDVLELVNEIPLITRRRGCDGEALSIVPLIAILRFGSARIEMSIDSCMYTYVSMDTHNYSLFENVGYESQGDLHRRTTRVESD